MKYHALFAPLLLSASALALPTEPAALDIYARNWADYFPPPPRFTRKTTTTTSTSTTTTSTSTRTNKGQTTSTKTPATTSTTTSTTTTASSKAAGTTTTSATTLKTTTSTTASTTPKTTTSSTSTTTKSTTTSSSTAKTTSSTTTSSSTAKTTSSTTTSSSTAKTTSSTTTSSSTAKTTSSTTTSSSTAKTTSSTTTSSSTAKTTSSTTTSSSTAKTTTSTTTSSTTAKATTSTTTSSTSQGPIVTDAAYIDTIVRHHNYHRANHSAPALGWSSSLAATAKKIAELCLWEHNTDIDSQNGGYGQNLGAGYPSNEMSAFITDGLYNGEVNAYTYFGKEPDYDKLGDWGHFSAIVWKGTTSVGCYTYDCKSKGGLKDPNDPNADLPDQLTVCNYAPTGNVVGAFPENVLKSQNKPIIHAGQDCPNRFNCVAK